MHSNMKQFAFKSGHALPISARSLELWYLQNRLGSSPKEDVATNSLRISAIGLKFSGMMNSIMITYSLRRFCGGRTATLIPQTIRRPY